MERRLVIKQILIMAGGLALLPSCLRDKGKSTIQLSRIDVSLDQENLLAAIAETLIPKTDTPGARELKLHLFVLKMLDDCYEADEQQQFMEGLHDFESLVDEKFAKTFDKLSKKEREEALLATEKLGKSKNALSTFYQIMKERTIGGYLNSKYVMTNLVVYELVPGRYNGYFPVKTA